MSRLLTRLGTTLAIALALLAPHHAQAQAQAGDHAKFLRYAAIANDGTIAFTYHDDIWIANPDGSNPRRLTANIARDFQPRFSPDGKTIAFTSDRNGNNDIFTVPVTGGEPKQITWMTGNDEAVSWTPDGKGIVFSTQRGAMQWGSPLYVVNLDGTVPRSLGMDQGRTGMIKQDNSLIAFNRTLPTYWRNEYRGNAAAEIAIMDLKTGMTREVTDTNMKAHRSNAHNVHPMWGADGKVYFQSERSGKFNIWRMNPDGTGIQQVTSHKDDGVQFPSISPDGKHMIYENNFELWTLDIPAGQPKQLTIRINTDPKEGDITVLTANSRADGYYPSPDGDYIAVDAHGEIFIVPTEQGVGEMRQVTNSAWRDDGEIWSPTGKYLVYTSDESREEELWVYELATSTKRKLTNQEYPKTNLTFAPNGTTMAYTANNHMYEIDVSKPGAVPREIAFNQAGGFNNISYAADGKWLIYGRSNDSQIGEIYLYEIATKKEINVTHNPIASTGVPGGGGGGGGGRGGGGGLLTPDGTHVVFTSARTGSNHLYVVSLTRVTEDVNDPLVRERKAHENAGRGGGGGGGGRGGGGGGAGGDPTMDRTVPPLTIKVDEAGIMKRAVDLTPGTNTVGNIFLSNDGRTIYYTMSGGAAPAGGGGRGRGRGAAPAAPAAEDAGAGLYAIGIDGQGGRRVATGNFQGLRATPDRRMVFFTRAAQAAAAGGGRGRGRGGAGPSTDIGTNEIAHFTMAAPTRVDATQFSFPVKVDRREEWQQTLLEVYRVMKYQFYDPNMHGKDWKAALAKYEPLLPYARTNADVQDIANEMIGELNASHTGVSLPATRSIPSIAQTKYLGFELEENAAGRYKVGHIYRDGPADHEWLDIKEGDFVLSIDDQDVKSGDNYWKLLTTTLHTYIPVKLAKTATGEGSHTIRVSSVTSLNEIKYQEWVNNNRDEVEKATNNEVAYVHIRAMDQPSLEQFEREIDRFWDRKGIIIDIRFNGGGNIDQELLDILERRPFEFWNNRSGSPEWGRRPKQAIVGPKVMMTNSRSVSDAEVTPQGFKDLQLGHIVGGPTSAQVIATGSFNLLPAGGTVRTPGSKVMRWDPTKPHNYGDDLENWGVEPDVWIRNGPMDNLQKNDKELKAAIAEVRKMQQTPPTKVTSSPNQ